jgi:hypothetical protein
MLGLEHLDLEPSRDRISLLVVGDQTNTGQALEARLIDAALLDGVFTRRSDRRGGFTNSPIKPLEELTAPGGSRRAGCNGLQKTPSLEYC